MKKRIFLSATTWRSVATGVNSLHLGFCGGGGQGDKKEGGECRQNGSQFRSGHVDGTVNGRRNNNVVYVCAYTVVRAQKSHAVQEREPKLFLMKIYYHGSMWRPTIKISSITNVWRRWKAIKLENLGRRHA